MPMLTIRRAFISASALLVASVPVQGQAADPKPLASIPEFSKLRTPQSPAFDILGLTPATVDRPSTPAAVSTSLLSSFTSGNQPVLPKQYALEVAPFWLVSHPSLTLRSMERDARMDSSFSHTLGAIGRNIVQTFTISVASADSAFKTSGASPADTSISRLGFSVRLSPIRGSWIPGCIDSVEATLTAMSKILAQKVAQALAQNPSITPAGLDSIRAETTAQSQKDFADKLKDDSRTCVTARQGFMVDLAAAGVGRYPGQSFSAGRISAYAGWITAGYDGGNFSVFGIGRVGKDGTPTKLLGRSYSDLGGKLIGAWSTYALSAEVVRRATSSASASDDSWRVTSGFDVKFSSKVWLNTSFGHDFRSTDARSLLALANFQYNFGDPQIKAK